MPRDSNGVYSLPAGYLAETGSTILASQHNPPLEDIGEALTGSFPRSGAAPMAGPARMVDGTEALPGVTFSSATGTGFYKTTAGIGVSINGTRVAEFGAGGLIRGARVIGEVVPFAGSFAPPLFVLPAGQVLFRSSYPDLWAFAQTEIGIGNPLWNNGNGSTTFGIPDLRGYVIAAPDTMNGGAAGRLTGYTRGTVGGSESVALSLGQIPSHDHGGLTDTMNANTSVSVVYDRATNVAGLGPISQGGGGALVNTPTATPAVDINHRHAIAAAGGGQAHPNVQPTMALNYILFAGA